MNYKNLNTCKSICASRLPLGIQRGSLAREAPRAPCPDKALPEGWYCILPALTPAHLKDEWLGTARAGVLRRQAVLEAHKRFCRNCVGACRHMYRRLGPWGTTNRATEYVPAPTHPLECEASMLFGGLAR